VSLSQAPMPGADRGWRTVMEPPLLSVSRIGVNITRGGIRRNGWKGGRNEHGRYISGG